MKHSNRGATRYDKSTTDLAELASMRLWLCVYNSTT